MEWCFHCSQIDQKTAFLYYNCLVKQLLSLVLLFFDNLLNVSLEALPFLALGYGIAGLIKTLLPAETVAKYLQRESWSSPIKSGIAGGANSAVFL